jgi:hypothetical protein
MFVILIEYLQGSISYEKRVAGHQTAALALASIVATIERDLRFIVYHFRYQNKTIAAPLG